MTKEDCAEMISFVAMRSLSALCERNFEIAR